jgi:hypothetical protein
VLDKLSRVYWYTVEFGLIQQKDGLRIYGAGIASSATETSSRSTTVAEPARFELERVMRTKYRIDDFQETYFVIDSLEELLGLAHIDFGPVYDTVKGQADLEPGTRAADGSRYDARHRPLPRGAPMPAPGPDGLASDRPGHRRGRNLGWASPDALTGSLASEGTRAIHCAAIPMRGLSQAVSGRPRISPGWRNRRPSLAAWPRSTRRARSPAERPGDGAAAVGLHEQTE